MESSFAESSFESYHDERRNLRRDVSRSQAYSVNHYAETLRHSGIVLENRLQEAFFKVGAFAFAFAFIVYWTYLEPDLGWLDTLYFTMATFTTVGCK